jgi:hypothetical protein
VKKFIFIVLLTTFTISRLAAGDDFCGVRNTTFQAGENITFTVFYSVAGIYVNAGTANFITTVERLNNRPAYHVVGTGTSNNSYDWIFKVRDRYESYFDTSNLQPMKFIRKVDEGGYTKYENITFNQTTNTAVSTKGVYNVPNCVQDVLSTIYYARNIKFDGMNVGDKIPFNLFLDNQIYNIYVRYLGRETIKTKYGKFRAIKFKPLLLKGSIFSGGEKMTVWVSDDANRIPLRIESPINVGSIKVDAMQWRNLRHPLTSLISWR